MNNLSRLLAVGTLVLAWGGMTTTLQAADVRGYSLLKGQFLNQTGPDALNLDPDFLYSLLISVDLADSQLLKTAYLDCPDGTSSDLEDYGDYWAILDSYESWTALNAIYGWGLYQVSYTTTHEGPFTCPLAFPETPLPPIPRLKNFAAAESVDPARSWTLVWDYDAPPRSNDYVQVYLNYGHGEVYSTPNLGLPGALDGTARSFTLPAGTLWYDDVFELNLEITRLVSTNAVSYPAAEGIAGVFSSTSIIVQTLPPIRLEWVAAPRANEAQVVVHGPPGAPMILQAADSLGAWVDVATNTSALGSNVFTVPLNGQPQRFFRARQP